jgi:hypothetical protein
MTYCHFVLKGVDCSNYFDKMLELNGQHESSRGRGQIFNFMIEGKITAEKVGL